MQENPFKPPLVDEAIKRPRRFSPRYWLGVVGLVILSYMIFFIPGFGGRSTWLVVCFINSYFIARYWAPYERFYMIMYNVLLLVVFLIFKIYYLLRVSAIIGEDFYLPPYIGVIFVTPLMGLAVSYIALGLVWYYRFRLMRKEEAEIFFEETKMFYEKID